MPPVGVIILHREPASGAGPLARAVAGARLRAARRTEVLFRDAGADEVRIVAGPPDGVPFGRRLAGLLPADGGVVVLGAGSIPLARPEDVGRFVAVARGEARRALANNRFSADVVAIGRADRLPALPDLPADNALPRWLEEVAGWRVADLGRSWRLQVDLDGPLDVALVGLRAGTAEPEEGLSDDLLGAVLDRLERVRAVLADRRAEVFVSGRTSSASLRWLERRAAARIRALVEERGLRASSTTAQTPVDARPGRPPRSALGMLLDRDGVESFGRLLAELGDAAIVDSRVLLAHRLGGDEAGWPGDDDRFASDLILPERIADPWLRALTSAARDAPIPVLLGGHGLVGPGIRLVLPDVSTDPQPVPAARPPAAPSWR